MFFTKFVVILLLSCIDFFRIVSNPGTILEVNLRPYQISPNSKKLYWVSFVQLKNVYLVFTTLPVSKNCFNCDWVSASWKVKKNHNFVDTPSDLCICNFEAVNTEHSFAFVYSLFSIQRRILVDTVSDIFSQKRKSGVFFLPLLNS